jgi:hypothetical protein
MEQPGSRLGCVDHLPGRATALLGTPQAEARRRVALDVLGHQFNGPTTEADFVILVELLHYGRAKYGLDGTVLKVGFRW